MHDSIPHYFLYGETQPTEEMEFIHCEPIFHRIEQQNWEIKPHRHDNLLQFFLLQDGNMTASLETQELNLVAPCLLMIPPGRVHGFKYNDIAKGLIITVAYSFIHALFEDVNEPWLSRLTEDISRFELDASPGGDNELIGDCLRIQRECRHSAPGRVPATAALLKLVLVQLGRKLAVQQIDAGNNWDYANTFEKFRKLVDQHYRDQWTVADYCNALGVGERKLNRICKSIADISPSHYIRQYLTQEAKRNLVYTNATISQVCYELGFQDPAYFSRFFSKQTGMSPKQYIEHYRGTTAKNSELRAGE